MSLAIQKAEFFQQDYAKRFAWYVDEASENVARRFQLALNQSLNKLANRPDLGRLRHFRNSRLQGLRSLPVERPFNKILIFYHASSDSLHAVRRSCAARWSASDARAPIRAPCVSPCDSGLGSCRPTRSKARCNSKWSNGMNDRNFRKALWLRLDADHREAMRLRRQPEGRIVSRHRQGHA